jgi:hypothetical protein
MDIKHKNMWCSNLGKTFISRHIPHQYCYACLIALPVRRNPQHGSTVSATSATGRASSATFGPSSENFSTQQTLPTVNRKHFDMNILRIESFGRSNTRLPDTAINLKMRLFRQLFSVSDYCSSSRSLFTDRTDVGTILWTRIKEMLGSKLGRNTGYPDWFSSAPPPLPRWAECAV